MTLGIQRAEPTGLLKSVSSGHEVFFKSDRQYSPLTTPFRMVVADKFIVPLAQWLLGHPSDTKLRPALGGSAWEAALACWFLLKLRDQDFGQSHPELLRDIKKKVPQTLEWIAGDPPALVQLVDLDGHEVAPAADDVATPDDAKHKHVTNWDQVFWPTAVCVRALLPALRLDDINEPAKRKLKDRCQEGITWLVMQWSNPRAGEYLTPSDLAELLDILLWVLANDQFDWLASPASAYLTEMAEATGQRKKLGEDDVPVDASAPLKSNTVEEIVENLVRRLVDAGRHEHMASARPLREASLVATAAPLVAKAATSSDDKAATARDDSAYVPAPESRESSESGYHWDDYFQSAEVMDALTSYVHDTPGRKRGELWNDALQTVRGAVRYLEGTHVDGRWGAHAVTARALHSYLRAFRQIPDLGPPEDGLVLKSARWLCDEDQRFSDGSFMHTSFISVFAGFALQELYTWRLARETVAKVYDRVVRHATVRTTTERGERMRLAVDYRVLTTEVERLRGVVKLVRAAGYVFALYISANVVIAFGPEVGIGTRTTAFPFIQELTGAIVTATTLLTTVLAGLWNIATTVYLAHNVGLGRLGDKR